MTANTSGSITLSWTDNATTETGFMLDWAVGGYWKPVAHLPANPGVGRMTFTHTGLAPNTTYTYRVSASPGSWSSGPTRAATTLPAAPTGVYVETVADTWISLRFAWPQAADNVIGYRTDSGITHRVAPPLPTVKGTAYFTDLQPSTRYCLVVASEGAGGRSPAEPLCATTAGPPRMTTVPRIVGLLSSQASRAIAAAGLKMGIVWNPTGEYRSDWLRVMSQSLEAGTSVREGTQIDYGVGLAEPQRGIASIALTNRHQQGRAVGVFVWDSVTRRWSDGENLDPGKATTLSLTSGRSYTVVAVDRGLINCTDGRPDTLSCQRFVFGALGDSEGTEVNLDVS